MDNGCYVYQDRGYRVAFPHIDRGIALLSSADYPLQTAAVKLIAQAKSENETHYVEFGTLKLKAMVTKMKVYTESELQYLCHSKAKEWLAAGLNFGQFEDGSTHLDRAAEDFADSIADCYLLEDGEDEPCRMSYGEVMEVLSDYLPRKRTYSRCPSEAHMAASY